MEIKTLKGNRIYLTKTPANIIDSKIENVLRIKMSCGGGIGGSKWYETVKPTDIIPNSLITVETIEGETKLINTNFIVEAVEKQLVIVTEVHQNSNFKETMGKKIDYYYLAPINVKIIINNKYFDKSRWLIE